MTEVKKIGLIGFGEVGSTFCEAMREIGTEILVYDILLDDAASVNRTRKMIETAGLSYSSLESVVTHSECIMSTVLTQTAKEVATSSAEYLTAGQIFIDLNSTSPEVKIEIGKIIESTQADFVEGAILGAVGATGANTRILTAGKKGKYVADVLNNIGLNATFYSSEIGKASMFKMLRSIFSKGLETIILELLIAGKRAGIDKDLWHDVTDFMSKKSFEDIAVNWIKTHPLAYERRYHEMVQVLETMKEIGIEPIMTTSTKDFFKRSTSLELTEIFDRKPDSFEEVIDLLEKRLKKFSNP
jgi:3-hydroxyisobutyrate dehydrogenase-like beta-hydroxyacid dehydrogenase